MILSAYKKSIITEESTKLSSKKLDITRSLFPGIILGLMVALLESRKTSKTHDISSSNSPSNRFDIVEHKVLDLDKGHEYENKSEFTRGNIAVIATLKHVNKSFGSLVNNQSK